MDESVEADVEAAGRRMAEVRPEIDHYVRAVMRARAATELFGVQEPVRVGRYELRRHIGTGGGGSVFVAWDPELAREVALKLVAASGPELRARAVAEGKALAQLSHPNIVPVFDVGVIDERVYLVMELIRGKSLRAFARDARPREIVAAYRQCARGLAAAHAVELVHRDFKPDNAVIDGDGRVRVIDFGLALDPGAEAGERAGTPGYMAPEQLRGEPVTPAVDQYALAVSLREAFTPTPKWLDRILTRAAAPYPAARFPSLLALDAALARDPATRWRRRAMIAAPFAIAVAAYAVGQARESEPSPCESDAAELSAVWSPLRRAELAARLDGLGAYARSTTARLAALDDYAKRWVTSRRDGCLAHQDGTLSAETYDRRQACLASAKTQLAALVDLGAKVAANGVDNFVRAIPELPDVAACADAAVVAPPTLGQRDRATALQARLDAARVRIQAGDDLGTELAAIVADAKALGYRPLYADALLARGTAYLLQWKYADAEAPLRIAYAEQLRVGDYRDAVEAFARFAWVRSRLPGAPPMRALDGLDLIAPLAEGLPANARFAQALLHNNVGGVWLAAGDTAKARDEFTSAIALAVDVTGPGSIELGIALPNLALVTDDPDARADLFARRIRQLDRAVGESHPLALGARIAAAYQRRGPAEAVGDLASACRRLAELHPSHARHVAECAFELAWLELDLDRLDDARRDAAIAAAASGPPPARARALLAYLSGDRAGAATQFRAVLADYQIDASTPPYLRAQIGTDELGLGLASDGPEATAAFRRGRAHLEAALAAQRWPPLQWRVAWLDRTGR
jgi:Protein kinase domain